MTLLDPYLNVATQSAILVVPDAVTDSVDATLDIGSKSIAKL